MQTRIYHEKYTFCVIKSLEHLKNFKTCRVPYLKVVGNEKEGGVKKVANDRNWPQTAAIEVCFPYNFAVVFDFMYFRFRPSKAK